MTNSEMGGSVFTDEHVRFPSKNKDVGLVFRHLGVGLPNKEAKLTVDSNVLGELFERLEIINRNPAVANGRTKIVIDYRSPGERLIKPQHEVFKGVSLNPLNTILGVGQAVVEENNRRRFVYITKLPMIPLIFDAQKHMEKEIRHEIDHLGNTPKYILETKESMRKFIYYMTMFSGSGMFIQSLLRVLNFELASVKDTVGLVGGIAIMTGGYQYYRRSSPIENKARIAEGVLKDKKIFIWPNSI